MKYFKGNWGKKEVKQYDEYYKSIEDKLSNNLKQVINYRHDTHIVKAYFDENNYIMELDEENWGKGKLVFKNATVKHNANKKDVYWLYEEVYKELDKVEIHISFYGEGNIADIIIICDDAYVEMEEKEYLNTLYQKKKNDKNKFDMFFGDIITKEINSKEGVCGFDKLNFWEQLLYSFARLCQHIYSYKSNNIEELMIDHYYDYSREEKEGIYITHFTLLEKSIIRYINTLKKYQNIIQDEDLNYILNKLLEVYNKKNINMREKNQLYLDVNEELINFNFEKIYERILDCVYKGLIK